MANPRSILLTDIGVRALILGNVGLGTLPTIPVDAGGNPTPSPTIFNTNGRTTLLGSQVGEFAPRQNSIDARISALGA